MRTKDKWKYFACSQYLSDWSAKVDVATLFDWMMETSDEEMGKLFDDYEVIVWGYFDDFRPHEIANLIGELATRAQETEALNYEGETV